MGPNGTKEKPENRKPFNCCCYCFAENCLVKLDFSKNGYYVQHLQWDVSEKQRGRRREDVKRRRLNCVCVCVFSVPKVILVLCVADCRRGTPQAAGGPFQVLTGGGQLLVTHLNASCWPLGENTKLDSHVKY